MDPSWDMVNSHRTWASQTPPGHISPGPALRPPARGEGRRLEDGEGDEKMVDLTIGNGESMGFNMF